MNRRLFRRIEKLVKKMKPREYTVELPDWGNPDATPPLTEKIIETKLREMELGSVLYLLGAGVYYKFGKHPDAVMCIHRSPLRDIQITSEQNIDGENENDGK